MTRRTIPCTLLAALLLALSSPAHARMAVAAGGQVADCRFATLQADLLAGGSWFYAPHQCGAPIVFVATITTGRSATLAANGRDITLSGAGKVRLFHVTTGTLALVGLTITGGYAAGDGGAILMERHAALAVTDSILHRNSTGYNAASFMGQGGAIAGHGGTITIIGSTLGENSTGSGGAGGAIALQGGTLRIAGSTFTGNHSGSGGPGADEADGGSGGDGGAIASQDGTITILGSTLSGNYTGDGGQAGPSCDPTPPSSGNGGDGGAINTAGGSLTIANSTLVGNHTGAGGPAGEVSANCDHYGGAYPGQGGNGAAITSGAGAGSGSVALINDTFSGNTLGASPSGADTGATNGALDIRGSTVSLANTLVAGDSLPEIDGSYTNRGGNVVGLHGGTLGRILRTDSGGAPLLAANGGPTQTVALAPGSPAIGAGIGAICQASPVGGVDQRGVHRPATGPCDSGAYQH